MRHTAEQVAAQVAVEAVYNGTVECGFGTYDVDTMSAVLDNGVRCGVHPFHLDLLRSVMPVVSSAADTLTSSW